LRQRARGALHDDRYQNSYLSVTDLARAKARYAKLAGHVDDIEETLEQLVEAGARRNRQSEMSVEAS